jgi:tetratricopeptide (TPR) repeat protein
VRRFIAARPQDPSGRIDLANRHAWLSDALFEAGAIDEAWSHRQQQLALLDAAVKADPRNADYRLHWAQFYIAVAKFPQTRNNVEASREAYRKARSYLDALLAGDPENEVIRSYRSKLDNAYRFLT